MRFAFLALSFASVARAGTVGNPTTLYSSENLLKIAASSADTNMEMLLLIL
jgi:hypothetical protein